MSTTITVELWLYGPITCFVGAGEHASHAQMHINVTTPATLRDVLSQINMPSSERGFTFINGILTATPGKQPDLDTQLHDGDRIALFHLKSMWPMQYRDGVQKSQDL